MKSICLAHQFDLTLDPVEKIASTPKGSAEMTDQMVEMLSFVMDNSPGADIFELNEACSARPGASPTVNHSIITHMDARLRTIGVEIQQWENLLTLRLHHPVVIGEVISPGDASMINATMQGTAVAYDDYHILSVNGVVGVGGNFVEAAADWQVKAADESPLSA